MAQRSIYLYAICHTFHVPSFKHLADSAKRSASAFSRADVELHLLKNTGFSTIDAPETVLAIIRQFLEKAKAHV